MELRGDDCDAYAGRVATLLEQYGVVLTTPAPGEDLETRESPEGVIGFQLKGNLPSAGAESPATIELREALMPVGGDWYATQRYEYELLDHHGNHRRAFHMHDRDWFARELFVLVHEHCERPIGASGCEHYAGTPVKDSYSGVVRLIGAWTAGPIDCSSLECLD